MANDKAGAYFAEPDAPPELLPVPAAPLAPALLPVPAPAAPLAPALLPVPAAPLAPVLLPVPAAPLSGLAAVGFGDLLG